VTTQACRALTEVFKRLQAALDLFAPGRSANRTFPRHRRHATSPSAIVAKEMGIRYDMVLNVFDRSIIEVENRVYADAMTTN
jgi:benzoyl-CoA reductase subunit A